MLLEKLVSRKLGAFLLTVLIILSNYVFGLNMPADSLIALVVAAVSYITGQAYVDGKSKSITDVSTVVTDIVKSQIINTPVGKTLPLDDLTAMFQKILTAELSKVNVLTLVTPAPAVPDPLPPVEQPMIDPV